MGMMQEFKDFAIKGNMVDMAVAFIMGGAFNKIISSFVTNIILPPVGMLMGGVNFKDLEFPVGEGLNGKAVVIKYGEFIDTAISFFILAFCIFMMVKAMNKLKKKEEAKPAAPPKQEVLLEEIRDALKAR